jgi:hypothetical protein
MKGRGQIKDDNPERDLLLSLATSDINLAQVFAEGARSAYGSGRREEGEFARQRTVKFYCAALRSVLRMTERDRESFSSELQNLRTQVEWLSVQSGAAYNAALTVQEDASLEKLLKLLAEKELEVTG